MESLIFTPILACVEAVVQQVEALTGETFEHLRPPRESEETPKSVQMKWTVDFITFRLLTIKAALGRLANAAGKETP